MKWFKSKLWYFFESEKCEFCRGPLRKHNDQYYGGIDVRDSIGSSKSRTAYVCNLCYKFLEGVK